VKRGPWPFRIFTLIIGGLLIVASENLTFRDHGDFARVIAFMSNGLPQGPQGLRWPFRPGGFLPIEHFDLASYVFWIFAKFQEPFHNFYDLRISSIALKLLLVGFAVELTKRLASLTQAPRMARYFIFLAVCLLFFVAHTIGVAKSFYSEYGFLLFFPALLYGLLAARSGGRTVMLVAGTLGCTLCKVQYFYLPTLIALCISVVALRHHKKLDGKLLLALACVQIVGMAAIADNPYKQLNYYQSTYFGSYMELTSDQQRAIGLTPRQQACIGVDAWGWRALDPGAATVVPGGTTCYGIQTLTLKDVLKPYLRYPWILISLLHDTLPVHFTTTYFHVFHYFPYISPSHPTSYGSGLFLLKLSELRDRTVAPMGGWILLAGLLAGLSRRRENQQPLALACLVLTLFVVSQLCIGILGEGARDLSKHWWAAQFALDALTLLLGLQAFGWIPGVMRLQKYRDATAAAQLRHDADRLPSDVQTANHLPDDQ
jgi:hypothetical protein